MDSKTKNRINKIMKKIDYVNSHCDEYIYPDLIVQGLGTIIINLQENEKINS